MNIELLEMIERTGSKLDKEKLLKKADGELRLFLEQALDPDITYGATVDESAQLKSFISVDSNFVSRPTSVNFWQSMKKMLDVFAKREQTGNSALSRISLVLATAPDEICLKWACRFINKQLRAGFDISTYNKAWGAGTVEKFGVQLADVYENDELTGLWFFQPKLDGNRVVFIDGKAMSRNGKEYPNCEHIAAELLENDKDFFKKWVLDGEMMGDLGFDKSSGALRRMNEKNREKATFTYWIFDLIDRNEWASRKTRSLLHRRKDCYDLFGRNNFKTMKMVPYGQIFDPTHEQVMKFCDEYLAQGFEGAMAKDSNSPYIFKRGKNLLKVKKFFDIDLRVEGFYEGKGRHKGRLGGLLVAGQGIQTKVGSGFPDDLREAIWNDQKGWLGAVVEIQYQEKTENSLRFPVFIRRRSDKE